MKYILLLIILFIISYLFINTKPLKKESFDNSSSGLFYGPYSNWSLTSYNALFYNYGKSKGLGDYIPADINLSKRNLTTYCPKNIIGYTEGYTDNFNWATTENWLKKPIVSYYPRDQGTCGCCYAFATITLIESIYYLNNLQESQSMQPDPGIINLSVQQIVECTSSNPEIPGIAECNGCDGCNLPKIIKTYFYKNIRLAYESSYPFQLSNTTHLSPPPSSNPSGQQTYNFSEGILKCSSLKTMLDSSRPNINYLTIGPLQPLDIIIENKYVMKRCIFNLGPMYVHYEGAENPAFANYPRQGGIIGNYVYNGPPQFGNKLLHSMVIIGWGKDTKRGGIEFWWVKNSYKEGWGLSNSKTGLTNLIKMKMKDPDGPDIFHSRFAIINYREECDSVQALLTLKRAPFIIKGDGVVLLNFDAYRIDPKTQDFLLTCQVLQAPAPYNITSVNTSPAQVDSNGNIKQGGMIVTDTDSKYWIPEGTRLIRSNSRDGTRFKGTIGLDGIPNGLKFPLVNHPQYGPLYKWRVSLSVINKITKNKIKEDIFEIIWDYAK